MSDDFGDWVTTKVAAQKTGYHKDYVQKLARESWRAIQEGGQPQIQVRFVENRYWVYLPDLLRRKDGESQNPPENKGGNT